MTTLNDTKIASNLKKLVGKNNVLYQPEEIIAYTTDTITRDLPTKKYHAIVFPQTTEDIIKIVKFAAKAKIPIIPRGAGTNLCGACTPLENSILMCFSKMNNILEINQTNMQATVQSGLVIADLQKELDKFNLFFPPDPSNLAVSTIGGAVALSSGGPKTFKYGTTKDYVLNLKIVLANGEVINTATQTAKNVSGYNLTQLFVGSEGTLGIITEITLKLIPKPQAKKIILAYFNSIDNATKAVNKVTQNQIIPAVMDLMDYNTINSIEDFYPAGLNRNAQAALLLELHGSQNDIEEQIKTISNIFEEYKVCSYKIANTPEEEAKIWTARRSAYGACIQIAPDILTEDIVVPRDKICEMVNAIQNIGIKYNLIINIMGHIADGNIHPHFCLDRRNFNEYNNFQKAKDELFKIAIKLGGTLSGEHGIGCEKSNYMQEATSQINIDLIKKIKNVFDPENILNPKKITE